MTTPHYTDGPVQIWHGDCIDVMRQMPDNSIDAVVTDPPYGLEFMGKEWDSFKPAAAHAEARTRRASEVTPKGQGHSTSAGPYLAAGVNAYAAGKPFQAWCEDWAREAYRLLKPGGHLLAFGGTRTFHRLTAGIEDAGFEIRDSLAWIYGQGFPKSADPGCRCEPVPYSHAGDVRGMREDVQPGTESPSAGSAPGLLPTVQRRGTGARLGDVRSSGTEGTRTSDSPLRGGQPGMEGRRDASPEAWELRPPADGPVPAGVRVDGPLERVRATASAPDRATRRPTADPDGVRQSHQPGHAGQPAGEPRVVPVEPGSQARGGWAACPRCGKPLAKGLGSALKPSFEPVVVARKPLSGTLAANVLAWGTGALNIDGSRIGTEPAFTDRPGQKSVGGLLNTVPESRVTSGGAGRWPANVILDPGAAAALDTQSGDRRSAGDYPSGASTAGLFGQRQQGQLYADAGGASRFFYTAKASTDERPSVDGIAHPTVKPVDLMRWLVKLVCPPGGTVLEPFAGSGTTVEACVLEGFRCIAIEREADYLPLILRRIRKPHAVGLDLGDWDQAPTPAPTPIRRAGGRTAPLRGIPAPPVGLDFGDDWELDA